MAEMQSHIYLYVINSQTIMYCQINWHSELAKAIELTKRYNTLLKSKVPVNFIYWA